MYYRCTHSHTYVFLSICVSFLSLIVIVLVASRELSVKTLRFQFYIRILKLYVGFKLEFITFATRLDVLTIFINKVTSKIYRSCKKNRYFVSLYEITNLKTTVPLNNHHNDFKISKQNSMKG